MTLNNIHGQSYDGAANMSVAYNNAKSLILETMNWLITLIVAHIEYINN